MFSRNVFQSGNGVFNWIRRSKLTLIAAGAALLLSLSASYTAGFSLLMKVPVLPVLLWLLAIAVVFWLGKRSYQPDKQKFISSLIWFSVFTAAALPWRMIDTAHFPVSLSGDEAGAGLYALEILKGQVNNPFILGWYSFPSLFNFFQAGSIAVLGQSIPGIRILSGLIGSFTVGAVYLLGRELFDHRMGLFAAIYMVGFHYHIHFSRIALNNIWDGLSFCLVLAAFWAGWKRENKFFFILSGLFAGFSLYFYETSKVLLVLVFLFIFFLMFFDRVKFKRCLPFFALFAVAFLIVAMPILRFYMLHLDQMQAHFSRSIFSYPGLQLRAQNAGLSQLSYLFIQLAKGFGAFVWQPTLFFYNPGTAILLPVEAGLFIIGLFACILFIKDPRAKLLVAWVGMFGLLGGLTESAPASQRYVAAAPVCVLAVALGIKAIENWITRRRVVRKKTLGVVVLFFMILISWRNILFYFDDYSHRSDYGGYKAEIETVLAENLNEIPGQKNVYYWGYPKMSYGKLEVLPFLAPDAVGHDMDAFAAPGNIPVPSGQVKIFVFLNFAAPELLAIQYDYPGGILKKEIDSFGRFLFWQYSSIDISGTPNESKSQSPRGFY